MKVLRLNRWNLSPKEAVKVQKRLSLRVLQSSVLPEIRHVAGADLAFSRDGRKAFAAVVVMTFPELAVVEQQWIAVSPSFPYIPGLLSFRETPALLRAFKRVHQEPDLILIDGHGLSHPRGFGIACHIGLCLDKPTIGCAKSLLFGRHLQPMKNRGSCRPLMDKQGGVIGAVIRTREGVRPIFVSVGHKINLPLSIQLALACARGYRIPEPTRRADRLVGILRQREAGSGRPSGPPRKSTGRGPGNGIDK